MLSAQQAKQITQEAHIDLLAKAKEEIEQLIMQAAKNQLYTTRIILPHYLTGGRTSVRTEIAHWLDLQGYKTKLEGDQLYINWYIEDF